MDVSNLSEGGRRHGPDEHVAQQLLLDAQAAQELGVGLGPGQTFEAPT